MKSYAARFCLKDPEVLEQFRFAFPQFYLLRRKELHFNLHGYEAVFQIHEGDQLEGFFTFAYRLVSSSSLSISAYRPSLSFAASRARSTSMLPT